MRLHLCLTTLLWILLKLARHVLQPQVKPLADPITTATIGIYRAVARELLPTPSKSHYLFNTRDLSKVIQGMMQATKTYYNSKDEVLQLWCHETCRVIADRMWDAGDKEWLRKQLDEKLQSLFSSSFPQLFEAYEENIPPFVNFMRAVGCRAGAQLCYRMLW